MARQVSLQELLAAIGLPLEEKSQWALLLQASIAIKGHLDSSSESSSESPTLLVTPESVLLNHGGSVQILAGIAQTSSVFTPPEMKSNGSDSINLEKCYIYALGMCLLSAVRRPLYGLEVGTPQHIFGKMIREESGLRPSLQEILVASSNSFESKNEASNEIDRLVSYVLGSTLEKYSDGEDLDFDEADLEAEIKEVMNMKKISSVENLYPPSYGSRASSFLSLGSGGVDHRRLSSSIARPHPDSPNMYSSLPVVFRSTSHNTSLQCTLSNSEEKSMVSENCIKSYGQTSAKPSYGSHFYTPSRRRKQTTVHDQINTDIFFRSSSDGKPRDNSSFLITTQSSLLDDVPILGPSAETAMAFRDSNSEVSLTCYESERDAASKQCETSFEYSELASSELVARPNVESGGDGNGFNFPSPPPISTEESKSLQVGMLVTTEAPRSSEIIEAIASTNSAGLAEALEDDDGSSIKGKQLGEKDDQIQDRGEKLGKTDCSSGKESNVSISSTAQEISTAVVDVTPRNSAKPKNVYKGSVGKLSKMLGPEFVSVSGFFVKEKQVAVKIPSDRRAIGVVLLNGCVVQFVVEVTSTCRELFNQVVAHQSLEETHIFGLAVITANCELFMELDRELSNYAPKGWTLNKSGRSHKRETGNFTVVFRVKYYVENVNQLSLNSTRHLYYLQLRKDILEGRTYCHEQSALKLAAYSLQAEWGDKTSEDIRVEDYLHSKVISKLGRFNVQSILSNMHSELHGLSRQTAQVQYLMEAQTLPEYGMVFYEVAKTKHGKIGSVWLGLSVRGIVVYDVYKGIKTPTSHWPWKKIKNLSYKNNRFILEVEESEMEESRLLNYFVDSHTKAQYLLHLSINYHRFQLLPRASLQQYEDDISGEESTAIMPEGESFIVEMIKDNNIIGLRLAGGKQKAFGGGFIYVQSINKGSIADLQGKIKDGDILIKVNGESVWGLTHREAAEKILSTTTVTLNIHRPYNPHWAAEEK